MTATTTTVAEAAPPDIQEAQSTQQQQIIALPTGQQIALIGDPAQQPAKYEINAFLTVLAHIVKRIQTEQAAIEQQQPEQLVA